MPRSAQAHFWAQRQRLQAANLRCLPVVKGNLDSAPSLNLVLIDSAYHSYQARPP